MIPVYQIWVVPSFNLFQCFGCKSAIFHSHLQWYHRYRHSGYYCFQTGGEHLIDYHFLFVAHVYIKFISTLLFFFPAGGKRLQSRESHLIYHAPVCNGFKTKMLINILVKSTIIAGDTGIFRLISCLSISVSILIQPPFSQQGWSGISPRSKSRFLLVGPAFYKRTESTMKHKSWFGFPHQVTGFQCHLYIRRQWRTNKADHKIVIHFSIGTQNIYIGKTASIPVRTAWSIDEVRAEIISQASAGVTRFPRIGLDKITVACKVDSYSTNLPNSPLRLFPYCQNLSQRRFWYTLSINPFRPPRTVLQRCCSRCKRFLHNHMLSASRAMRRTIMRSIRSVHYNKFDSRICQFFKASHNHSTDNALWKLLATFHYLW